jgi:DNA-binding transcriptional ArsR family regulator
MTLCRDFRVNLRGQPCGGRWSRGGNSWPMRKSHPANKARKLVPPVQRLAIALKHPLRVRILSALVAGDRSATQLSGQLGDVSVGDASYHLNVLAKECRLVDRVRSRQVRGAVERFFRLRPGVLFAVDAVTVDQRGMTEIDEALEEAIARIKGAELSSRYRLESTDTTGVEVAVAVAAIQTKARERCVGSEAGSTGGFGALRGTNRSWRSSAPEGAENGLTPHP